VNKGHCTGGAVRGKRNYQGIACGVGEFVSLRSRWVEWKRAHDGYSHKPQLNVDALVVKIVTLWAAAAASISISSSCVR
jgi:hypothetical protein